MWTIRNTYGYRYAKICILPTVSLSNGRHLTWLCDLAAIKLARWSQASGLYLGWRWSQASGAVPGRCSGEVLRLGSDGLFSAKKEHTGLIENFDRTSHYWSLLALHYQQQQQQFLASAYEAYGSGVNVDFTMGTSSSYTGSGVKWPYKNKG